MINTIKNVCCLLLLFVVGTVIGYYYGWLSGSNFHNDWLTVSAFNSGYDTGYMAGSSQAMYLLFEDYVKSNPYKVELPNQEGQ